VTPATDVYALGAVAYHCVAGRPPFTGGTALQITLRHVSDEPPPLPPDVPPELRTLITRAMNKAPTRRYPTAAHFAAAVRHSLTARGATSPTTVDLPVPADAPGRTRRARRYVTTAAGAVAMLLLGARANAVAGPAETTRDGGPAPAHRAQRAATDR
jgi:eukaryotic-like serine/threonine-protein kinase